jgi:hypothetical protein
MFKLWTWKDQNDNYIIYTVYNVVEDYRERIKINKKLWLMSSTDVATETI